MLPPVESGSYYRRGRIPEFYAGRTVSDRWQRRGLCRHLKQPTSLQGASVLASLHRENRLSHSNFGHESMTV